MSTVLYRHPYSRAAGTVWALEEAGAIVLYLADRYAYGKLAPAVDDPARGTYLRWSFFAPSVIEPGAMAKSSGWEAEVRSGRMGKLRLHAERDGGRHRWSEVHPRRRVLQGRGRARRDAPLHAALRDGGAEARVRGVRRAARPALQRADAKNAAVMKAHGLGR